MRWLRFAVLILAATILQTSLTGIIAVTRANIKPDLLLILLVFFAVRCNSTDAVIASFAIGFAADLAGPTLGLMGPRTISFGLIGTLVSDLHNVISTRRVVYQAITILLVGVLTAGLSHVLALLRAETTGVSLSVELLWQPLYSAVLGPFFFLPVGWWMRMNQRSRRYGGRRSPFR